MARVSKLQWAGFGLVLAMGVAAGWLGARHWPARSVAPPPEGREWVARIGDRYIDATQVSAEMRRRGGERPGLFQDAAAKRALLDDLLLQQALVDAARAAGLDQEPETRRAIDQLLVSRYLAGSLYQVQKTLKVDSNEVTGYYNDHADDYAMPARRRVAMLHVAVPAGAPEEAWAAAAQHAAEALEKARKQAGVADFGNVAIDYSSDQATRYRGGSLGWLTDARKDTYSYDPALLDVAFALENPGDFSDVVRGKDGLYVARLVERQDASPRPLSQLRGGIEQMLMQRRYADAEARFRSEALADADIEVREDRLSEIAPPGPPARTEPEPPPAAPGAQEAAP